MQLMAAEGAKKALRLSAGLTALLRLKARERDLDVEGLLRAQFGVSDDEHEAPPEVCGVDDGEAVRRLHLAAEQAATLPAKPCRWFNEMPDFV